MFDFSDAVPIFAYLCLLLILFIGFAATSYAAYRGGKRSRRRDRYTNHVERIEDSLVIDGILAFTVIFFPAWMIHGLSLIRFIASNGESHTAAMSLWGVAAYWFVAWGIGFAYVKLMKREVPVSSFGALASCLASFSWFTWGFQPLNDLFLGFSGG